MTKREKALAEFKKMADGAEEPADGVFAGTRKINPGEPQYVVCTNGSETIPMTHEEFAVLRHPFLVEENAELKEKVAILEKDVTELEARDNSYLGIIQAMSINDVCYCERCERLFDTLKGVEKTFCPHCAYQSLEKSYRKQAKSFQEKSLEVARTAVAYSFAWFFAEISIWELDRKNQRLQAKLELAEDAVVVYRLSKSSS